MNSDFVDLLAEFSAQSVEYLVVGAHALAAHGYVRATNDLDLWVRPRADNAPRVLRALAAFGAPLHDLVESDFLQPGLIFQIGLPPLRIDVLTAIDGLDFQPAWAARIIAQIGGLEIPVLSRHHLIMNKRATGRLQDLADVEKLEEMDRQEP